MANRLHERWFEDTPLPLEMFDSELKKEAKLLRHQQTLRQKSKQAAPRQDAPKKGAAAAKST